MKNKIILYTLLLCSLHSPFAYSQESGLKEELTKATFEEIFHADWTLVMDDTCTGNWKDKWFLDGERATVKNSDRGMHFSAGPIAMDDSCHSVIWTKETFSGDIKIEYDYTRMDSEKAGGVNILYILASGIDEGLYHKDISRWSDLREIPAMSLYLRNMNLLHISYAAFGSDAPQGQDYVRARYYPVPQQGAKNRLTPSYFDTGLFKPGATYRITAIKRGEDLFFNVEFLKDGATRLFNPETDRKSTLFHWKTSDYPEVKEGRVGLRQMATRASRYKNFRVSTLKAQEGIAEQENSPDTR